MSKTSICIVGAGAIGGFYGSFLVHPDTRISAIVRSNTDHIRQHGYRIYSIHGEWQFQPENIYHHPTEIESSPDLLIITTKAVSNLNLSDYIKPLVGPETVIMIIQNGIYNDTQLHESYPNNLLISGLAFIGVTRTGAGIIEHTDHGRLTIGKYPDGSHDYLSKIVNWMTTHGAKVTISETIQTERWKKLVWNTAFNPLSVIYQKDTKALCRDHEDQLRTIMTEVMQLATADGHHLSSALIDRYMTQTAQMTPYKTSMLVDHINNRDLEIDAILTRPIQLGHYYNVPCPNIVNIHQQITQLIR